MSSENKSTGQSVETNLAPSTHLKFKRRCAKLGVSMSQRIRDMVQMDNRGYLDIKVNKKVLAKKKN